MRRRAGGDQTYEATIGLPYVHLGYHIWQVLRLLTAEKKRRVGKKSAAAAPNTVMAGWLLRTAFIASTARLEFNF